MDKNDLIRMLNEGLSVEEIPTISNLEELKELVENSNLDSDIKKKIHKNIDQLIKDTIWHSKAFSSMIRDVQNG